MIVRPPQPPQQRPLVPQQRYQQRPPAPRFQGRGQRPPQQYHQQRPQQAGRACALTHEEAEAAGNVIEGKKCSKAPKIQRLVAPLTLQRKRARIAEKKKRIAKAKSEAAEYQKLLATRLKEQRERRSESLAKKRSRLSAASKPSVVA